MVTNSCDESRNRQGVTKVVTDPRQLTKFVVNRQGVGKADFNHPGRLQKSHYIVMLGKVVFNTKVLFYRISLSLRFLTQVE